MWWKYGLRYPLADSWAPYSDPYGRKPVSVRPGSKKFLCGCRIHRDARYVHTQCCPFRPCCRPCLSAKSCLQKSVHKDCQKSCMPNGGSRHSNPDAAPAVGCSVSTPLFCVQSPPTYVPGDYLPAPDFFLDREKSGCVRCGPLSFLPIHLSVQRLQVFFRKPVPSPLRALFPVLSRPTKWCTCFRAVSANSSFRHLTNLPA